MAIFSKKFAEKPTLHLRGRTFWFAEDLKASAQAAQLFRAVGVLMAQAETWGWIDGEMWVVCVINIYI